MKLRDLSPNWSNHQPMASGVAFGIEFSCPNDPLRKRRHRVCFTPPINPYPQFAEQLAAVPPCVCRKWTRVSGSSFDDLTLTQSIGSHDYKAPGKPECCHIHITDGQVSP